MDENYDYFVYAGEGISISYIEKSYMNDLIRIEERLKRDGIEVPKWLHKLVETYEHEFNETPSEF